MAEEFLGTAWWDAGCDFREVSCEFTRAVEKGHRSKMLKLYNKMLAHVAEAYEVKHGKGTW